MDTAPLKGFATWARSALIREVAARVAAVLAPGSSERVEQGKAVAALEAAIVAAGGGDRGRAAVADKVAYTWFNRIVALRFMDANGYTGIGVVSPQAGVEVGQPEVLAEAKRGVIDAAVVSETTRADVSGLLDGTRASGDAQGEAYALLLESYCNHWHKTMSFMFEHEGDFTELLIPSNLLADDSVLNRAVKVLTADVCADVEVIGWLYQFYISERKDEVFAGFKKNKKAGAEEIPAATQLFTPHWIVRYLVENSLGRLWMLNHPSSGLVEQMDYYIAPIDEETDFLEISRPEELTVIDPACGSGHMLTYAFDLLYAIYEEEGYGPADIPSLILANNLYGTEIDPRAGALAAFALIMKARAKQRTFFDKNIQPMICVIEPIDLGPGELKLLASILGDSAPEDAFWNQFAEAETLGALIEPDPELTMRITRHLETLDDGEDLLIAQVLERARRVVNQANYLLPRYNVLVANPPYMGSKNMNALVAAFLKTEYAIAKSDLFSAFFVRSLSLLVAGGEAGFMSPFVWMFISSYRELREHLLDDKNLTTLIQLEYSGFDGATVPICAFTIRNARRDEPAAFVRLAAFLGAKRQGPSALKVIRAGVAEENGGPGSSPDWASHFFRVRPSAFKAIPGSPIAFWLTDATREAFVGATGAGALATLREGINTGNNDLFLRRWWEVGAGRISADRSRNEEPSERWVPHKKGGSFRKWAGNEEYVLDWGVQGERIHAYHGIPLSTNGAPMRGKAHFFQPSLAWSRISSSDFSLRAHGSGFSYDSTAPSVFGDEDSRWLLLALLNSVVATHLLGAMSPTLDFRITALSNIPLPANWRTIDVGAAKELEKLARSDWNSAELSWEFEVLPWVPTVRSTPVNVAEYWTNISDGLDSLSARARELEEENNRSFISAYGLEDELNDSVPLKRVSLRANARWRFPSEDDSDPLRVLTFSEAAKDLVSYAIGCMFGRYSLDEPGLILADQGSTLQKYFAKVPSPTFPPDADNVIPMVDGDWFDDDIVERFRLFLRVAFGERHFEENLRFITDALGVKSLRSYFVKSFFKDHVQRYKKRPIYWLFSSPEGSFNALIYMHRYTSSTVSTVLNEYLREFQVKVKASLEQADKSDNAKEADRLRNVLVELDQYEHDVLYPLASRSLTIDLDDGVKVNYPKLGAALKKVAGLEAAND